MDGTGVSPDLRKVWANRAREVERTRRELNSSADGSVLVIGSHQSGKTALIESCEEALHLDLYQFPRFQNKNNETVADKSTIISKLLHHYTGMPEPTDKEILVQYYEYINYLACIIGPRRERRQAWLMQGRRRTRKFEDTAKGIVQDLIGALKAPSNQKPDHQPASPQPIIKDRRADSNVDGDSQPISPLLIFENWLLTPRRVSTESTAASIGGGPPTNKPQYSKRTSNGSGSHVVSENKIHPRGLTREEALIYIKSKIETRGIPELADNKDCVSSAVYRCAGGHVGAVNLVLEAIFDRLIHVEEEAAEAMGTSTNVDELTNGIEVCLRAYNKGSGVITHFVDDLMASVGIPEEDDVDVLDNLRHESLMITADGDDSSQHPFVYLLQLFSSHKERLEGVFSMDLMIDPATLSALAILVNWMQPGAHAMSKQVGEAIGNVIEDKIYKHFKKDVDSQPATDAPIAESTRPDQLQSIAQATLDSHSEPEKLELMKKTKKLALATMRDEVSVPNDKLQELWVDFTDKSTGDYFSAQQSAAMTGSWRLSVAETIYFAAVRNGKVPELLDAIRAPYQA